MPSTKLQAPIKFNHFGEEWEIRVVKRFPKEEAPRQLWGLCDYKTQTIRIAENQPDEEKMYTLLHELLHLAFPFGVCSDKLEERIVSSLERPLLELLKNVGLVDNNVSIEAAPKLLKTTKTPKPPKKAKKQPAA